MRVPAKVWKSGKQWIAQAPSLDAMTQGNSRQDALAMLEDWVKSSLEMRDYKVKVRHLKGDEAVLSVEDPRPLVGLMLQRARLASGASLNDVREKLNSKSRNAYRQYESGDHDPGLTKLGELVRAVGYELEINLFRKQA